MTKEQRPVFVLLDLDDTILDFHKAEAAALARTLEQMGVAPEESIIRRYSQINARCWELLELGLISREKVLIGRFEMLFSELELERSGIEAQKIYEELLGKGHCGMRHTLLILALPNVHPVCFLRQRLTQAHHIAMTRKHNDALNEWMLCAINAQVLVFQKTNKRLCHSQTNGVHAISSFFYSLIRLSEKNKLVFPVTISTSIPYHFLDIFQWAIHAGRQENGIFVYLFLHLCLLFICFPVKSLKLFAWPVCSYSFFFHSLSCFAAVSFLRHPHDFTGFLHVKEVPKIIL